MDFKAFKRGLLIENPVFSLFLGICSTLAITTSVNNAIGMGLAVFFVLVMSNIIISALRKWIPDSIHIPVYIVIIATLVKCIQLLMQAYTPSLNDSLGVFIPLIVVNCIILGRAEAFASKNGVLASMVDGIGMSLGYFLAIFAMSFIRECLSTGQIVFNNLFDASQVLLRIRLISPNYTLSLFQSPVGAFVTFAFLASLVAFLKDRKKED